MPIGTFNQTVGGSSIGSIAAGDRRSGQHRSAPLPTGLTLGAGRFLDCGTNFALLLRALRGDGNTNILQTPSIITLDNEEAEIKVAQEVPFLTGSFTNTGVGNQQGPVNPFQTIQREEVGNILKITPQINEGDAVLLKIEQEDSSVAQGAQGAVDLITNKRTISTTVLVDDGGMIVLGGLITDTARESENRVPILGSIPIIGELFKTRSGAKEKRNLMVFIRPTILRDGAQAAIETNAKYNVMRNQQLSAQGQGHVAAGRAAAAAAADRRAVEVRRSDRRREEARAGHRSDRAGADRRRRRRNVRRQSEPQAAAAGCDTAAARRTAAVGISSRRRSS